MQAPAVQQQQIDRRRLIVAGPRQRSFPGSDGSSISAIGLGQHGKIDTLAAGTASRQRPGTASDQPTGETDFCAVVSGMSARATPLLARGADRALPQSCLLCGDTGRDAICEALRVVAAALAPMPARCQLARCMVSLWPLPEASAPVAAIAGAVVPRLSV